MEDTDDEVEVLPPSPRPEERRYDACGVRGWGESEFLFGGGVPRWEIEYTPLPREFRRVPLPAREAD